MAPWSPDRIAQLAPDAAAAAAGAKLADRRHWPSTGHDDAAVWGECRGSGAKPYQVRVAFAGPAFKCSCPSRKFPCKHCLGLMRLLAGGVVAEAAAPEWVSQWLRQRSESAGQKAAAPAAKPVDAAKQADRRAKRLGRVDDGLAALRRWTDDLVRAGIAAAPSAGPAFFDEPARRLVDAQAPGAARRIRELAAVAVGGTGWQARFAERLAALHLLTEAFARRDALPGPTRHDVSAELGLPVAAEDLAAVPPVVDAWQVLAVETDVEDRLRVRRTWLWGERAAAPALLLAFAHGESPFEDGPPAGTVFDGGLAFYPGNGVRAALPHTPAATDAATATASATKQPAVPRPLTRLAGLASFDALCDRYADRRAAQPWLGEVVWPVSAVTPVRVADAWHLADAAGRSLPTRLTDTAGWRMMACAGGRPVDAAVAFDGHRARPLAVVADGEYVPLTGGPEDAA